mgnify:CR=1 FL=1
MSETEAVKAATLELIKSLQQRQYLNGFYLVGGTAMAVYYNHRVSIDIDLFSNFDFDANHLLENIQQDYSYQLHSTAENTLKGRINDINVDIIAHRYPYIHDPKVVDDIYLLSIPDIIAMKLNAISISGQRAKDFVDIYYTLGEYSISEMIKFYQKKYSQENSAHVLKSLIYFDDVNPTNWPIMIEDSNLEWSKVKSKIEKEVLEYIKNNR